MMQMSCWRQNDHAGVARPGCLVGGVHFVMVEATRRFLHRLLGLEGSQGFEGFEGSESARLTWLQS